MTVRIYWGISNLYKSYEIKFNENVNELRKFNDALVVKYSESPNQNTDVLNYMDGFFKIYVEWENNGKKTEPISVYNEIILKTLAYNKHFDGHSLAFETNNYALNAQYQYINLKKIDHLIFKHFKSLAFAHRRASRVTDMIIKILK